MTTQSMLTFLREGVTNALVVEQIRILRQEEDLRFKRLQTNMETKLKNLDLQIQNAKDNIALFEWQKKEIFKAAETLQPDVLQRVLNTTLILKE